MVHFGSQWQNRHVLRVCELVCCSYSTLCPPVSLEKEKDFNVYLKIHHHRMYPKPKLELKNK